MVRPGWGRFFFRIARLATERDTSEERPYFYVFLAYLSPASKQISDTISHISYNKFSFGIPHKSIRALFPLICRIRSDKIAVYFVLNKRQSLLYRTETWLLLLLPKTIHSLTNIPFEHCSRFLRGKCK